MITQQGMSSRIAEAASGRWPGPNSLAGPVTVGVLGSLMVAVANRRLGPAAWGGEPSRSLGWFILFYAGLAALVGSWLALGLLVRRGRCSARAVVAIFVLWSLPMLVGLPLMSRDLYSYGAQGKLLVNGWNPYHATVSSLGADPFAQGVSSVWRHTPVPYGPLFLLMEKLVVHHAGTVSHTVEAFRVLNLSGIALMLISLPIIAKQRGKDPAAALWLGVASPLVVLHLVGGGHNEALMVGLLLAALALSGRGRHLVAAALIATAAAIKAPAALGLVVLVAHTCWIGRAFMWKRALGLFALAAATFLTLQSVSGVGWGWLRSMLAAGVVRNPSSLTTAFGLAFSSATHLLGIGRSPMWALSPARLAGEAAAAVIVGMLVVRGKDGAPVTLGLALLAVVVLAPVFQPWYLLWTIPFLASETTHRLRRPLIAASAIASFLAMPSGSSIAYVPTLIAVAAVAAVTYNSLSQKSFRPQADVLARPLSWLAADGATS